MSKLQYESRSKHEHTGRCHFDRYTVIIPYRITEIMRLQDGMTLHVTATPKAIRLYKIATGSSIPVRIKQKRTRTYKNQQYYTTRITIPLKIIRQLHLQDCKELDIDHTSNQIIIRPQLPKTTIPKTSIPKSSRPTKTKTARMIKTANSKTAD